LTEIEKLATDLLKFVTLNYTGIVKILKKNFKKTGVDLQDIWLPRLHKARFFNSRSADDAIHKTTLVRREVRGLLPITL